MLVYGSATVQKVDSCNVKPPLSCSLYLVQSLLLTNFIEHNYCKNSVQARVHHLCSSLFHYASSEPIVFNETSRNLTKGKCEHLQLIAWLMLFYFCLCCYLWAQQTFEFRWKRWGIMRLVLMKLKNILCTFL